MRIRKTDAEVIALARESALFSWIIEMLHNDPRLDPQSIDALIPRYIAGCLGYTFLFTEQCV